MEREARIQSLKELIQDRIVVLDGAMGTAFQAQNLRASDFGGETLEGCNENLNLTRPDLVKKIHEDYLAAGCDIIETNTFGATPLVLDEYGLGPQAILINQRAAEIARQARSSHPFFVAGSMGPTTKAISITGGVHFSELTKHYYVQAKGLFQGGVDYFLLETAQDSRNIKAALIAIDRLHEEVKITLPIALSCTIETTGTMLGGQTAESFLASFEHRDLLYLGLNCATGPEFMTDSLRTLAATCPFPIACVPNAGLPNEYGKYSETPPIFSKVIEGFLVKNWVNLIGGCCGTEAGHIQALSELARKHSTRKIPTIKRSTLSGVDFLEVKSEERPTLVGERTNVIGSKKFKELITASRFEEAAEVARAQIKNGAQIVDVCLANPDRNETEDMKAFLEASIKCIRAPIMIDSTDPKVVELALTYCQGKSIINSINLEDGVKRFEEILPLARQMGAAIVVGTIDDDPDQGMGVTRERKLSIAKKEHALLAKALIPDQDIYWDPLVFPCGTGDAQYIGSALETIEGIKLIKEHFPHTKTILGISNVSFGLPSHGREVLNAVFLYHAVQAGLDLAIVNTEKLARFPQIPVNERELCENLLFTKDPTASAKALEAFASYFKTKTITPKIPTSQLSLEERLSRYVLEGTKDGLQSDLDLALQKYGPFEIINGPLMAGMDEVGRLFNANKLIVAEVLQSAESMKAAVAHLEPHIAKTSQGIQSRGKIILATVKGDVHDIGKNLVDIILSNNGFNVVNLGIKIPPEQIMAAIDQHKPDMIGLSGLLVKSAHQMAITADDLSKKNIQIPILVGGAALTPQFVDREIASIYPGLVAYAKDAMTGLTLAKTIMDPIQKPILLENLRLQRLKHSTQIEKTASTSTYEVSEQSSLPPLDREFIPKLPDLEPHLLSQPILEHLWKFINPLMLYTRHLGISGKVARLLWKLPHDQSALTELKTEHPKALQIWEAIEEVKMQYLDSSVLKPSGIYRYFRAHRIGNRILLDGSNGTNGQFRFLRKGQGLCLSDYVHPDPLAQDSICLFAVTAGKNVREEALRLKDSGAFLKSHILQSLAIETAEAYAEYLHSQIRLLWGYPDPTDLTMMERFQAKYRGKRYSFGYPACPRLEDQVELFRLIKPEQIGIELTEGYMMDPEASVSAIVFHHPQATYFSVGSEA